MAGCSYSPPVARLPSREPLPLPFPASARADQAVLLGSPPIQTNAPLRLPLEVIEQILELALPPETLDPAYKNPRTQFLLRLGLVCRWLHTYAEQRLLEGMITVERSLGMKRWRRCLKSSPGRGQKVQQLHLVLENDEKMWLVEPQQDKAVTALLAVCTGLKTLRLSCPDKGRSSVESTALAGVERKSAPNLD